MEMDVRNTKPPKRSDFPKNFLWGASLSTHQVEGGNTNQWSRWEHETAARLAATAERRLSYIPIWDSIKDQAKDPHNYVSGNGIDHYNKYPLDFKLAHSLNLNTLRSGVEWSRINPSEGVFDAEAVEHYANYFQLMAKNGLEPIMNLFHWSVPQWFADKGGFAKRSNLRYWRDFVHTVVHNMDMSNITYVITINEANSFAGWGYVVGDFPPGEKNILKSLIVYRNLALAHRIAYKIIKTKYPEMQVGVAHQLQKAEGQGWQGKLGAWAELYLSNWWWLKKAKYHDFIGLNYYFADYRKKLLTFMADANPKKPLNDLGWYMEPSGIEWVIREVSKRHKNVPILITENGVADIKDTIRGWWLAETLNALRNIIEDGIPLIGYLHWTLIDNFEWQHGWFPKYGLIAVDRSTMKRTVKSSAKNWAKWLGKESSG
jgi:beta-glucosidase